MVVIKCCKDCVAPKRHTACWGHCPEYAKEKAEYEKCKQRDDDRRRRSNAIYSQRSISVTKALRKHGR